MDPFTRYGCRLIGTAQIVARGEAKFDRLLPLFLDYGNLVPRFWAVVVVTVTRALPLSSPAYDGGATEDEVRQSWTERFRVLQPGGRFVERTRELCTPPERARFDMLRVTGQPARPASAWRQAAWQPGPSARKAGTPGRARRLCSTTGRPTVPLPSPAHS